MPREDGLGLHDDESGPPTLPDPRQPDPQQAVRSRQRDAPRASPFQDVKLVSQGEDFKLQGRARGDRRAQSPENSTHDGHAQGYARTAITSTETTRTEFLVGTAGVTSLADRDPRGCRKAFARNGTSRPSDHAEIPPSGSGHQRVSRADCPRESVPLRRECSRRQLAEAVDFPLDRAAEHVSILPRASSGFRLPRAPDAASAAGHRYASRL